MRVVHFAIAGLGGLLGLTAQVGAQSFPTKPITIIVPFAAGGTTDVLARALADRMTRSLGKSVVIVNKPGAGGAIGTEFVARADPDGHTLLMGTQTGLSVNPSLIAKLGYDPQSDFAPITLVATTPLVLTVSAEAKINSVQELVKLLKETPGKHSYGSSGNGTSQHLTTAQFNNRFGLNVIHVPYKGSSQSLTDLAGGQITMLFDNLPSVLPLMKGGKLKGLAVTTAKRSELAPELPTLAESGLAGFEIATWIGLLAPKNTPAPIISTLHTEVVKILNDPQTRSHFAQQGFSVEPTTPAQFTAMIAAETVKFGQIIKANKITID